MQAESHTFPLPETETHKLDDLQGELISPSESNAGNTLEFVQTNRWWLLGAAALSGITLGWLLQRRK